MNNNIKEIFNNIIQLSGQIDKIIYHFRTQNYDIALRMATGTLYQMDSFITLLIPYVDYFNADDIALDQDIVYEMLKGLLQAQENKDYILLADLYEMQLTPFLIGLQEKIILKENYGLNEELYQQNLKAIEQTDTELWKQIMLLPSPLELMEEGYMVEPTSCGLNTIALFDGNNKRYYLHSNNQVLKEGLMLANSWYYEGKTKYIVYGYGLGYHVRELSNLDSSNIKIEVYESDIKVIKIACAYSGIHRTLKNPNIKLIYDPELYKLIRRISSIDEQTEFVIHYPSLRNIKNSSMREKLEDYFIQYSSVKNQLPLLIGNFNQNISNYDGRIDELNKTFLGKDLFIVAAGPSLDKNFQQLKEVEKNAIILATGTVYRKLINAGITPDYVIVTDANPRVYAQISGLETKQIPILFLSTANKELVKNYAGRKYIILQKYFRLAEDFALKNGFMLFQTGGSVSTTALDIGITFNCKRIIFLGLDLAFTNNFVHATETSRRELTNTEDLREVEDIDGNLIYTSKSLDIYRRWIENRIKGVQGIEFIDATEGGAKIEGFQIKKLSECIIK